MYNLYARDIYPLNAMPSRTRIHIKTLSAPIFTKILLLL